MFAIGGGGSHLMACRGSLSICPESDVLLCNLLTHITDLLTASEYDRK